MNRRQGYKKLIDDHICIYCGLPADVIDHLTPWAWRDSGMIIRKVLVPACKECNSLLSSSLQTTVGERIQEAKTRLEKRYLKLLKRPVWTLDELLEVSENLRVGILQDQARAKEVRMRLAFQYFRWIERGRPAWELP